MIKAKCDKCKKNIKNKAGLAFAPPIKKYSNKWKFHLCRKCWNKFLKWLKTGV